MNPYYDAEAIHFIENVCEFLTLDAAHRQVVHPLPPKKTNVTVNWPCQTKKHGVKQAIFELKAALDAAASEKVLCWVVDGLLDRALLWKLSWALNSVGHSIVPVSTYDWLIAVKHARSMM